MLTLTLGRARLGPTGVTITNTVCGDFGPQMHTNHHPSAPGEYSSDARGVERRLHDALTDLIAYALTLEGERLRFDALLLELAEEESSAAERRARRSERDEVAEELAALRRIISAL